MRRLTAHSPCGLLVARSLGRGFRRRSTVCFLALVQWRVLEQWMSGKGLGTCARKLVAEISTIKSMEVIIPVKRGETRAELTVRTVARPDRRVAELLTRLELELPARNRILGEAPAGTAANAAT